MSLAVESPQITQAERLVRLALERYRLGRTDRDEAFAVPRDGPNIAMMLRGSKAALRSALAREYRRAFGETPNGGALGDALTILTGEANDAEPEPVHLRVAALEGGVILDLGDIAGRAIEIKPGAWHLLNASPVLFRRTALCGELPLPLRGGDLDGLRDLLNVTGESWSLLLGWLVAALLPDMPHAILMLGGEHGSGKSSAARVLIRVFDPSPAPLRSQPRDVEQWAIAAAGSWGVAIDNVSSIPVWLSDCLCKAVTGDGWVRRRLYTDGELAVLAFRRVVALTSIDAGVLRGDLGDRLALVDLEPIPSHLRRTESELEAAFVERRPSIFGALLDLVADVLAELPNVKLARLPRMADFTCVLAAMDRVAGTNAVPLYLAQTDRIAADVLEADPVGAAIVASVAAGEWTGTPTELLDRIRPERPDRNWPSNPRALSGRLTRLRPTLRTAGIQVDRWREAGGDRRRMIRLVRSTVDSTVPTVPSVPNGDQCSPDAGTVTEPDRPENRPAVNTVLLGTRDGRDGRDGEFSVPAGVVIEWI